MFDLRFSLQTPPTCLVRLIDRRTGQPLRIDGQPLRIFTRDPAAAAREMMSGRNRAHWAVRIDPLGAPLA